MKNLKLKLLTWAAGTTRKKRWYSGFKILSVRNVSVTYWRQIIFGFEIYCDIRSFNGQDITYFNGSSTFLPCEKRLEMGDLNQDQTQDIYVRLVCKQISRGSPK